MYIINPLKGMGGLLFGADQSRIEGILGPPEFMVGEGVYQYTGLVVVAREGKVYSFLCGDANGAATRHVEQCPCRTAEGIGMGSSEQELVAAYGEPTMRRIQREGIQVGYRGNGMAFFLRDDKVYFMSAGMPRDRKHVDDRGATTGPAAAAEAPKK